MPNQHIATIRQALDFVDANIDHSVCREQIKIARNALDKLEKELLSKVDDKSTLTTPLQGTQL